ncbi:general odorant-binding protein 56d-like [Haematobia irritans]|uniref:general odorant-binding protein 56d-like n=1 Tax=Haematobia irritans TaxID=7368 RepID=UPI003F50A24C
MKYLSIFALVVLLAGETVNALVPVKLSAEQMARAAQVAAECIAQEKTTKDAVIAFSQGEFSKADKNVKCYANCFLTKAGILVDGVVQPSVVKQKLEGTVGEEKLKAIMEKCGHLKGSDNCETAFMLFECYHKEHADIV